VPKIFYIIWRRRTTRARRYSPRSATGSYRGPISSHFPQNYALKSPHPSINPPKTWHYSAGVFWQFPAGITAIFGLEKWDVSLCPNPLSGKKLQHGIFQIARRKKRKMANKSHSRLEIKKVYFSKPRVGFYFWRRGRDKPSFLIKTAVLAPVLTPEFTCCAPMHLLSHLPR